MAHSKILRIVLCFFNIFCLIGGIALILTGQELNSYERAINFQIRFCFKLCGILIFCVGMYGCISGLVGNLYLIVSYAVVEILQILAHISLGVVCIISTHPRKSLRDLIFKNMYKDLRKYQLELVIEEEFDQLQRASCCGVRSVRDWLRFYNDTLPESCCVKNEICKPNVGEYHEDSCGHFVYLHTLFLMIAIASFSFVYSVLQIFGVMFSVWVLKTITREQEERRELWI